MSFFKDFKDDLSQAVNELMPEESKSSKVKEEKKAESKIEPKVEAKVEEKASKEPVSYGQDDIADLLKNLDSNKEEAAKTEEATVVHFAEEEEPKIEEPLFDSVAKESVEIPVYTEATEIKFEEEVKEEEVKEEETVQIPVTPIFTPEEPIATEEKKPVEPVFSVKAEPVHVEEKKPVEPVFTPSFNENSKPINTVNEGSMETGVIPNGMTVTGDIESSGSLTVLGTVKGNITVEGKLTITGCVEGNSKADDIHANGAKIVGELTAEHSVNVEDNTVIKGNVKATSATFAGAVKGDIDVQGPVVLDSTAVIMGNVKSKSIQINNGAAIEGLCSQVYAGSDRASIFED